MNLLSSRDFDNNNNNNNNENSAVPCVGSEKTIIKYATKADRALEI